MLVQSDSAVLAAVTAVIEREGGASAFRAAVRATPAR